MMGEKIDDSHLRDNDKIPEIEGLGLLPAVTTFGGEKTVIRRRGRAIHPYFTEETPVDGYEIHFGVTRPTRDDPKFAPLFELDGRRTDSPTRSCAPLAATCTTRSTTTCSVPRG